jgi:hypothetical protein
MEKLDELDELNIKKFLKNCDLSFEYYVEKNVDGVFCITILKVIESDLLRKARKEIHQCLKQNDPGLVTCRASTGKRSVKARCRQCKEHIYPRKLPDCHYDCVPSQYYPSGNKDDEYYWCGCKANGFAIDEEEDRDYPKDGKPYWPILYDMVLCSTNANFMTKKQKRRTDKCERIYTKKHIKKVLMKLHKNEKTWVFRFPKDVIEIICAHYNK